MIVTFIRSSSYAQHSLCPHSFFLTYCLGLKSPSGKKATIGNIVHKALEVLARVKKARQENSHLYEDEIFGVVENDTVTPEWATRKAFDYYASIEPQHDWRPCDLDDCIAWTQKTLDINKGMFNPLNQNIVEAEQKFDFCIEEPWAHYKYDFNGEVVEGQLGLKGTMDLVVENEPGFLEIIDYKTGQRKDWAKNTNEKKTYDELRYDPQLCLYHLAATRLFPEAQEIFVTIIYINDGGPYTLCFDKSDVGHTEQIIREKFEAIRDTKVPQLVKTWKCKAFCPFSKPSPIDPTTSICEYFAAENRRKGADRVFKEYGSVEAVNSYGSGGGRK